MKTLQLDDKLGVSDIMPFSLLPSLQEIAILPLQSSSPNSISPKPPMPFDTYQDTLFELIASRSLGAGEGARVIRDERGNAMPKSLRKVGIQRAESVDEVAREWLGRNVECVEFGG